MSAKIPVYSFSEAYELCKNYRCRFESVARNRCVSWGNPALTMFSEPRNSGEDTFYIVFVEAGCNGHHDGRGGHSHYIESEWFLIESEKGTKITVDSVQEKYDDKEKHIQCEKYVDKENDGLNNNQPKETTMKAKEITMSKNVKNKVTQTIIEGSKRAASDEANILLCNQLTNVLLKSGVKPEIINTEVAQNMLKMVAPLVLSTLIDKAPESALFGQKELISNGLTMAAEDSTADVIVNLVNKVFPALAGFILAGQQATGTQEVPSTGTTLVE